MGGSGGDGAAGLYVIGNRRLRNELRNYLRGSRRRGEAREERALSRMTLEDRGPTAPPEGGGTGIIGSDLTIINSGSIAGGMNGTGTAQADAIKFTDTVARASTLEITSTSVISGNVVDAGGSYNFVLGGTTRGSFNTLFARHAISKRGQLPAQRWKRHHCLDFDGHKRLHPAPLKLRKAFSMSQRERSTVRAL